MHKRKLTEAEGEAAYQQAKRGRPMAKVFASFAGATQTHIRRVIRSKRQAEINMRRRNALPICWECRVDLRGADDVFCTRKCEKQWNEQRAKEYFTKCLIQK